MTPPNSVHAVLDKPGKYLFRAAHSCWFFEVDDRRQCHQLTPHSLERDGLLSLDGWLEGSRESAVVPLSSGEIA